MPQKQEMLKCENCGEMTQHLENTVNHTLHLILSIVTVGFWMIIWFFLCVGAGKRQCMKCGQKSQRTTVAAWIIITLILLFVIGIVIAMC